MMTELAQEAAELIKVYKDKKIAIDNWQYRVQALLIAVAQLQHTNNNRVMQCLRCQFSKCRLGLKDDNKTCSGFLRRTA